MELGALQDSSVVQRYARSSIKCMWSPIKLWVLFNMRILDSSAFCLFPREHRVAERPPQALIDTADRKLVLFANWLLKDYSAQSASQYVSAIKSKHTDWLGGRLGGCQRMH